MSQRDQFAMRAMQGILTNKTVCEEWPENNIAEFSYKISDAMLKERERTNKSKAQKELEK